MQVYKLLYKSRSVNNKCRCTDFRESSRGILKKELKTDKKYKFNYNKFIQGEYIMAKLYFKYGCMGSSKSMDLLRTAYNYEQLGKNVLVLKSSIDTRDEGVVRSRIGIEHECICVNEKDSIINIVFEYIEKNSSLSCILVDEVQFLSVKQIEQLWLIAVESNIPVICYGLRIDYRGKGFPASERLFTLAHSIEELKTICECGKKATHHLLYVNGVPLFEGESIFVGDTEFKSVCGSCWFKAKTSK